MNESFYIIDSRLKLQPLTAYLSKSGTWSGKVSIASGISTGEVIGASGGIAVPITADGELRPGVPYQSSGDPNIRLPSYRLQVVNVRYTSSLKWRTDQDDPNGPLAFLTLILEAVPPQNTGFILQQVPHEVTARIGYQIPLQDQRSDGAQAAANTDNGPMLWIEIGALQSIGDGMVVAFIRLCSKRKRADRLIPAKL